MTTFVREYKHGARAVMRPLSSGFVEPGETPEQGTRRELLEVEAVPLERLLGSTMTAEEEHLDDASSLLALSMARSHLEALGPSS